MYTYIIIALVGFIMLGITSLLDKFILSKRISSPAVYTFYVSVFSLLLILLFPFVSVWPKETMVWLIVIFDAFCFFIGLIFMFKGVKESEISHVGPLIGAAVPFFTIFLSRFFLNEILTERQILAIAFLIFGSLVIAFEKSKKHNGIHRGMIWGVLSGLFFAASHIGSKFLYQTIGFYSGTILIRASLGLFALALLFLPAVRSAVFAKKAETEKRNFKNFFLVFFNTLLGVTATLITQYAISIGSVSVVNSLEGVRYAVLVIAMALLSVFFPKFLKEEYSRWEIFQEISAVVLIGAGLWLLI